MYKNINLTNRLAEERAHLANERTLLSYVRTAISFIVSGLILIKFFENGLTKYIAFTSMLIGTVLIVIGIYSFFIRNKKIEPGSKYQE